MSVCLVLCLLWRADSSEGCLGEGLTKAPLFLPVKVTINGIMWPLGKLVGGITISVLFGRRIKNRNMTQSMGNMFYELENIAVHIHTSQFIMMTNAYVHTA